MWRTFGHDKAVNVLQRSLTEGRLSHAYMLTGPPNVGKMTLALDLARAVNCLGDDRPCGECDQCGRIERSVHADVSVIGPGDGDSSSQRVLVSIDQVREAQRQASLKPFEGRSRVFVFSNAEQMSDEAANSLLKTLEEPPDQVLLVLLASSHNALPPTVVSRCQIVQLKPVSLGVIVGALQRLHDVDSDRAQEIARLSGGRPGWAVRAATETEVLDHIAESLDTIERLVGGGLDDRFAYASDLAFAFGRNREPVRLELSLWLRWWRDLLLIKHGRPEFVVHVARTEFLGGLARSLTPRQLSEAISTIDRTLDLLDRNMNPRLALESMMLSLPRPGQAGA